VSLCCSGRFWVFVRLCCHYLLVPSRDHFGSFVGSVESVLYSRVLLSTWVKGGGGSVFFGWRVGGLLFVLCFVVLFRVVIILSLCFWLC
jgi:hypothetical protein